MHPGFWVSGPVLGRIVRAPVSTGETFIVQLKGRNDLAVASLWAEKKVHRMREKVLFFLAGIDGVQQS